MKRKEFNKIALMGAGAACLMPSILMGKEMVNDSGKLKGAHSPSYQPTKVIPIDLDPWVSKKAKEIVNTRYKSMTLEYWKELDYDRIVEPPLENGYFEKGGVISRGITDIQCIGVVVYHEGELFEKAVYEIFAQIINRAVAKDLIGFGCLLPPSKISMVGMDANGEFCDTDTGKLLSFGKLEKMNKNGVLPLVNRTMLIFYPYMSKNLCEGKHQIQLNFNKRGNTKGYYFSNLVPDLLNNYLGMAVFSREGDFPGYEIVQGGNSTDFKRMEKMVGIKFSRYIRVSNPSNWPPLNSRYEI